VSRGILVGMKWVEGIPTFFNNNILR